MVKSPSTMMVSPALGSAIDRAIAIVGRGEQRVDLDLLDIVEFGDHRGRVGSIPRDDDLGRAGKAGDARQQAPPPVS